MFSTHFWEQFKCFGCWMSQQIKVDPSRLQPQSWSTSLDVQKVLQNAFVCSWCVVDDDGNVREWMVEMKLMINPMIKTMILELMPLRLIFSQALLLSSFFFPEIIQKNFFWEVSTL